MNALLPAQFSFPTSSPHTNHPSPRMSGQKRRREAEDDGESMSISPSNSPAITARPLKKVRNNEVTGGPLSVSRLLETLDAQSLRAVLQSICERRPEIGSEVVTSAPKPSASATLEVLSQYQDKLRNAFPFGGNAGSEYAYNRVKQHLTALIDALTDFTPQYLPPNETNTTTSLNFLEGATKLVHELPNWDSQGARYHKDNAYDEISRAWAVVISEGLKRGGGFQLHSGGWDQRLARHHEQSGGRMQAAVNALGNSGWLSGTSMGSGDVNSIRNELLSGRYGPPPSVRVGW